MKVSTEEIVVHKITLELSATERVWLIRALRNEYNDSNKPDVEEYTVLRSLLEGLGVEP